MSLLPHISQRYSGVTTCIIESRISEEVTDAECVNINLRVALQVVPDIDGIVFLLKSAKKAERKAARIHLHILFYKSKRGIL